MLKLYDKCSPNPAKKYSLNTAKKTMRKTTKKTTEVPQTTAEHPKLSKETPTCMKKKRTSKKKSSHHQIAPLPRNASSFQPFKTNVTSFFSTC